MHAAGVRIVRGLDNQRCRPAHDVTPSNVGMTNGPVPEWLQLRRGFPAVAQGRRFLEWEYQRSPMSCSEMFVGHQCHRVRLRSLDQGAESVMIQ
ncbi:hypothetical protein NDU88_003911 [Pleurodeles waltl]|uniref:Uncharacterized protein n=1 Tax=Pleurodeles waltl TaxID=8319 RepID=A0AAV7PDI1_PLEWA|nr:hypothetical protein NDU88_003911 [Pleurodeles waltl]